MFIVIQIASFLQLYNQIQKMIVSIILALLVVNSIAVQNTCTPQFLLPQTLHDTVSIYSFTTNNSKASASYSYQFISSIFTAQPNAILSISSFHTTQFTELNFNVAPSIVNSTLLFIFTSTNMVWTSLQLNFILHSRSDIFTVYNTISNTLNNGNLTVSYSIPNQSQMQKQYIFANFILGVICKSSSNYLIEVTPFSLSNGNYQVTVLLSIGATVTIQTTYYQSNQTNFASSFNSIDFSTSANTQYATLWANFAPIVYSLVGFSKLSISSNSFSIASEFDLMSNVVTMKNIQGLSQFTLAYLAIGSLPVAVCAPCDNFISISGCLSVCPNTSYPSLFDLGGKTCRQCPANLGLSLNSQKNGCVCNQGLIYFRGNCYDPTLLPPTCSANQVLINKLCVNTIQTKQSCPQNSILTNGICQCNPGFIMDGLGVCESACPVNSNYNSQTSTCVCINGYQLTNGKCVAVLASSSVVSVISITCPSNQVLVNSVCVCNSNSISVGNNCVACPAKSFKNEQANQCQACYAYCLSCTSALNCNSCSAGFNANTLKIGAPCTEICGDGRKFVLSCDDGNKVSGDGCSENCTVQNGYVCNGGSLNSADKCVLQNQHSLTLDLTTYSPTYTSFGIITDFIINPPVKWSQSDLINLFSIKFSDQTMRPKRIVISPNEKNLTLVRCFFDYQNCLKNGAFQVSFTISKESLGTDHMNIMYNTLKNQIKSAMSLIGNSDILN